MKLIDLTHTVTDNMPVYPGDPCARLYQTMNVKEHGVADEIIESGMHVGTHMDAPFHMIEGGIQISEIPLRVFSGRGVLVDARGRDAIGADLLKEHTLHKGDMVLIMTQWDKKFRDDDYYQGYPEMEEGLAQKLADAQVNLVGMDTPSPDSEPFPVHKILLGNDVMIVENMTNLEALLPYSAFKICAYPVKYQTSGAPVRVVAEILDSNQDA